MHFDYAQMVYDYECIQDMCMQEKIIDPILWRHITTPFLRYNIRDYDSFTCVYIQMEIKRLTCKQITNKQVVFSFYCYYCSYTVAITTTIKQYLLYIYIWKTDIHSKKTLKHTRRNWIPHHKGTFRDCVCLNVWVYQRMARFQLHSLTYMKIF